MYTRVSTPPTSTTPTATPSTTASTASTTTTSTKDLTMRIDPSDILFAALALTLLLATALVAGGLMARPFAG